MDTVGCRRPRNATSSLTDLPGCPSVTSDRATSTISAEETDTLAHSSMMSDMRRGTQRHRGMPAVMLRHISVTTLRTSLTPAGVREQQTLRLSFSPHPAFDEAEVCQVARPVGHGGAQNALTLGNLRRAERLSHVCEVAHDAKLVERDTAGGRRGLTYQAKGPAHR